LENIDKAIEAILFVAGDAVMQSDIAQALDFSELYVSNTIDNMIKARKDDDSGIQIVRVGEKVQLTTNKAYEGYIKKLFMPDSKYVITNAAIETLSIVAYNQPITRGEIEQVRGVSCTYSLNALLNKGLIYESGRKETIGYPKLYKTTDEFLRHFDISSVNELPELEIEQLSDAYKSEQDQSEQDQSEEKQSEEK
jgi:segregation and condensation protein B